MTYTPKELTKILLDTQIASIRNEVILKPELDHAFTERVQSEDAPQLGKLLYALGGNNALMGCLNYWQIRDQIHDYQREHDVSGIVEESRLIRGIDFKCQSWNDQLLLLERDLPTLKADLPRVLEFFLDQTTDYDRYIDVSGDDYTDYIPIDEAAIRRHARNATRCWIWSCSSDWKPVEDEPGAWMSCAIEVPRIDDDKIEICLNLDRPDSDGERIYIVARHRDKSRFPWL